jgi:XTP/dITP diphosphohydrolase
VATFVLATANPHKAEEMRQVLAPLGVELLERPTDVPDVEETESTLEGNALLKARALSVATGQAAIADDTGLFIEALDGRPGVWSARYAGEHATYADNVDKALRELANVPDERRQAQFRSVISVVFPDGSSWSVEGTLTGTMARAPRGEHGFGYDPIFVPDDEDGRTLAELSAEEKNALSHRGRALRAFAEKLLRSSDV